jgi:hypothetical protein
MSRVAIDPATGLPQIVNQETKVFSSSGVINTGGGGGGTGAYLAQTDGTLNANASPTYTAGKLVYDSRSESLTFFNNDSNVSLQVGQEEWIRVKNVTGSTIANGAAVYITGASAGLPTVAPAQSNASATTICAGLATEAIANNAIGYVTCIGLVNGLDTSGFAAGATLFVSSTVAGGLVSTAPSAPNYRYRVGIVGTSSATVGTIHVTPSTAALANGTANQLFGMNNAGTAQEVKTIQGTSGDVTVTHGAGTITLDTGTNVVTLTGTQTLTNKRVTKRVSSPAFSATPSINTDNVDMVNLFSLTGAITSLTTNLTGTPNDGDELWLRFKDDGTARAITHGASFTASGTGALLTTTVAGKYHEAKYKYNSTLAKWACLASDLAGY